MAKKKLINRNHLEISTDVKFVSIYNALRNFKKLSEQEAIIYIEIMKKKQITIKDLMQILKKDGAGKTTTTKPYAIIKNLVGADLLFCKDNNSRNKTYTTIHPRDLILDIKESMDELDDEVSLLESEELQVFQQISENSELLETEYQITNTISSLIDKGYQIDFYYNPILIDENHMLYKRLVKHFSLNPKKGKFSMVMAIKKEEKIFPFITILLLKNYKIEQKDNITGIKIVDPEIHECLRRGVPNE